MIFDFGVGVKVCLKVFGEAAQGPLVVPNLTINTLDLSQYMGELKEIIETNEQQHDDVITSGARRSSSSRRRMSIKMGRISSFDSPMRDIALFR